MAGALGPLVFGILLNIAPDVRAATSSNAIVADLTASPAHQSFISNSSATEALLVPLSRLSFWGTSSYPSLTNPPVDLTNAIQIAAGYDYALALRSDGTVSGWGNMQSWKVQPPSGLSNLVAVGAGRTHAIGLQSNGKVINWGIGATRLPAWLSDVVAISAGDDHDVALRVDGSVVAWGSNTYGQTNVPSGLSNVIAVAAGYSHCLALKKDGTVVAWGTITSSDTKVVAGLSNIVAIAAGDSQNLALRSDGNVVSWGRIATTPPMVTNAMAIAAGFQNLALTSEGSVVQWSGTSQVTDYVAGLTNIAAVSVGNYYSMALAMNGLPIIVARQPSDQTVYTGDSCWLRLGMLASVAVSYQWQLNGTDIPDATNAMLLFPSVKPTDAGLYSVAISSALGTILSSNAALSVFTVPPNIEVQPVGGDVRPGSNVVFAVTVSGPKPIALQWRFNGVDIVGATNATLAVTNIQPANAGYYSLVASNSYGTTISSNAQLTTVDLPLALGDTNIVWLSSSQQPAWYLQSSTTHDGFVAAAAGPLVSHTQSSLQAQVNGPGTLRFWYLVPGSTVRLLALDNGKTLLDTRYSSTGSTWRQASACLGVGAHVLSWVATNELATQSGMAYLDDVSFVLGATPASITSHPAGATNAAGTSVTFSTVANGTPAIGFQWYLNGAAISGATSSIVALKNLQSSNTGVYSVMASNAWGSQLSSNAVLKVTPSGPVITVHPAGTSALIGSQATFAGVAIGTAPIFYQWLFNGSPIAGATNSSLAVANSRFADSGSYSLEVSNSLGTATSSNAYLNVYTFENLGAALDCPQITWSTTNVPWFPQTNVAYDGISAAQSGIISNSQQSILRGVVEGPATLTYWWKVNCDSFWVNLAFCLNGTSQSAIAGSVDWQQATNYIGAGSQTLEWRLYPLHDAIAGGTGWVDQVQVVLGGTPPTLRTQPSGALTIGAGNSASFSVASTGTPPLRYQWRANGTNIPSATNAQLSFSGIQTASSGVYDVMVANDFGSVLSSNVTLTVTNVAPVITQQPASQSKTISSGATFSVAVKGSTPMAYQWLFNGSPIPGESSTAIALSNLRLTNAGGYSVIVSNSFGAVTSSMAFLEVGKTAVVDYWPMSGNTYPAPFGIGEISAVAAGRSHIVALRLDGTVVAWGSNYFGVTNVPSGLDSVAAIAAGDYHTVALRSNGTVVAWGDNTYGQLIVPDNLSNVVAIAAMANHTFALRANGTVAGWGNNNNGQIDIPSGLSNVQSVAAGFYNGFAVKTDGTVVQWGNGALTVGPDSRNVAAVAAGTFTAVTLSTDGRVQRWFQGESSLAAGFSGIVGIAIGGGGSSIEDYVVAITQDGGIVCARAGGYASVFSASLTNVIGVAAAPSHAAVLIGDGTPRVIGQPLDQTSDSGSTVWFSSGVVGARSMNYRWQFNEKDIPGATNQVLALTNVPVSSAGSYRCIVGNKLGTITNQPASLAVRRTTPYFGNVTTASLQGISVRLDQLSGHGPVRIYTSSNLFDWAPVFTNPPQAGSLQWLDNSFPMTNQPTRFYRAIEE